MSRNKSFTVMNPKCNFWLCIVVLGLLTIPVFAEFIMKSLDIVFFVCLIIFVYIPGLMIAFGSRMYRVKVNDTKISVRKKWGLVNFSLDISDITAVKWIEADTTFGQNDNIKIFTSQKKHFKIETVMINSDKFIELMNQYVEESKITKIHKSMVKHNNGDMS
ncbi:MAG: hypothetical protein PUC65_05330 [Clostridiales bacterium]|nr:hypothetical protein [Clostridiales bacterium]